MKKATITDVARQAGVSIKTVSRVINREPNVRESTRARVAKAIEKLRYRPSTSARSLAGSKSFLLALLYDNPSSSYVTNVQNGLLEVCQQNQYDLLIHPCDYQEPSLTDEIAELVRNTRVDGLVLTPPVTDRQSVQQLLRKIGIPHVLISPRDCDDHDMTVCTNDREASSEMVQYLASLGHDRIAFIQGHPDHEAIGNRFDGYRDGLTVSGLPFRKSLCVQGFNSFESGVEQGRRLLSRKSPPTAIFASNDDMAAGVVRAAHEAGFSVPRDVSVAGFDDIPLARYVWPALTTIRQEIRAMGHRSAELLLRRINAQDTDDLARIIDSELVIRDSTGPARNAA
ncbi:MAG: LacI family DNA-binding transcriptional regulator [Xanthomonadales bacterium]|nr:LacI family DNA-binding transcriptional regulator [Xanthomonadales bacterium]